MNEKLDRTLRIKNSTEYSEQILREVIGKDYIDYRNAWAESSKVDNPPAKFPIHLDLELQDFCNQSCVMCPRNSEVHNSIPYEINSRKSSSIEIIKQVISEGIPKGLQSINFGAFSEPLLHKSLWDLVKFSHDEGIIDSRVITNGLLLNRYISEIFTSNLKHLFISLDAFTENTYKQIRGVGFNRVIENINLVLNERKLRGVKLPIIRVSFVDMEINSHEKNEFVSYWSDKVDYVDVQQWSNYAESLETLEEKNLDKKFNCRSPWQRISILANGDILPCCDFNGRPLKIGNIHTETILEAWESAEITSVRNGILNDSSPICSSCQRGKGI